MGLPQCEALVIEEKERPIVHNGAANRSTEIVAFKGWDRIVRRIKKIFRIQRRIAQEMIKRSVNLVGTGLCRHTHLAAGRSAVFGRVGASLYFEFLNHIDRRFE